MNTNPLSPPSAMNSQLLSPTTQENTRQQPSTTAATTNSLAYATMLNSNGSNLTSNNVLTTTTTSIVNGGRQQQYHRPLLRGIEENNSNNYDGKENKQQTPSDTLPFDNYRATNTSLTRPISSDNSNNYYLRQQQRDKYSNRNINNHSYAGANRLSDDEYDRDNNNHRNGHQIDEDNEREADDEDEDEYQRQIHPRTIPSSSFVDTSIRTNPNSSSILMMMKGNGNLAQTIRNDKPSYEHRTVVVSSSVRPTSSGSSSSSSSLPVDEQQQQQQQQQQQSSQQTQQQHHIRPRGYNFVPAPFNGSRLIAKSTEQLNRSFANDSLVKYCTPPSTPPSSSSLFPNSNKTNSPTSILKQNYLQKYTHNSSKTFVFRSLIFQYFY